MPTDTETPSPKTPEPPAQPRPYTKPAVERIPLNEAKAGKGNTFDDFGVTSS